MSLANSQKTYQTSYLVSQRKLIKYLLFVNFSRRKAKNKENITNFVQFFPNLCYHGIKDNKDRGCESMKINFTTNDYLLTWNILFGSSLSKESQQVKEKLWNTYKKQYNEVENDKDILLEDYENFIPDDDTLYNLIFETELFKNIKENALINRKNIMEAYDHNKKKIDKYLNSILKVQLEKNYNVLVMDPNMDTVIRKNNSLTIGWGKREDQIDYNRTVSKIIKKLLSIHFSEIDDKYKVIKEAVLELAIDNELFTRLSGKSSYNEGHKAISSLKKQIYPYWLMYLGIKKEDFMSYMMRDNIVFEIDDYDYERDLRKLNFIEFVDFCIKNQKTILRYFKPQMIERKKEIQVDYDKTQSKLDYQNQEKSLDREYQFVINNQNNTNAQTLEII